MGSGGGIGSLCSSSSMVREGREGKGKKRDTKQLVRVGGDEWKQGEDTGHWQRIVMKDRRRNIELCMYMSY